MDFETIETERLTLRALTPEVYDYLYKNFSDEECIAHLGLKNQSELEAEKEKYRKGLSAYDRTFIIFQLIEKKSGAVIGMSGFVRYYPKHFRAELGYSMFINSYKRKEFMYEACVQIIKYGFETMNLTRIEALVGPENEASLKLIEKLNFKKETVLQKHYYSDGIMYDSVLFSRFS